MKASRGVLALLLTVLIWGSTYIITKSALNDIGPFALAAVRFVIGYAILVPFAWRQGYRLRMSLKPEFVRFGLTGVALYYIFQNLSLQYTTAVHTVLVQSMLPAVTAVLAVVVLKERLRTVQVAGLGLVVLGAVVLTGRVGDAAPPDARAWLGNAFIIASVLTWAVYTIQGKRMGNAYPSMVSTTASIGAGLLMLLPAAGVEAWQQGLPHFTLPTVLIIVYLGVASSALTMFLWNYALETVDASIAGMYVNLVPLVGVAIALLAGESITLYQIIGGCLTLGGVWLSGRTTVQAHPHRVQELG
ncbi:MAG: DMT family transporter [Anaerolineae bacterium]